MSKKEQIAKIAETASITKAIAERCYTALVASLHEDLTSTGKAELQGIGTFKATPRAARTGRNPRTGDKIEIAAGVKVSFSAGKAIKDAVN